MQLMKPLVRRTRSAILLIAVTGAGPWVAAAAEPPAAEKKPVKPASAADKAPPSKHKSGAGEFVSFKDGTLTLKGRGGPLVWTGVGENFKTYERDAEGSGAKLVGTAALGKLKAGMAVRVNVEKSEVRYGTDEHVSGTFVSYKGGKLVLIGRAEELGESYTKKYGTHLGPQIDPKTPVEESVDGGPYKAVGTAEYLSTVKEGTVVTLHGVNDAVTLVRLGVKKQ